VIGSGTGVLHLRCWEPTASVSWLTTALVLTPLKTGAAAGVVALGGANTYTGLTYINGGALRAQNNSALGTTAAGTIVLSGAALEISGLLGDGHRRRSADLEWTWHCCCHRRIAQHFGQQQLCRRD